MYVGGSQSGPGLRAPRAGKDVAEYDAGEAPLEAEDESIELPNAARRVRLPDTRTGST